MARKPVGKDKGWCLSEDAARDHLEKVIAANKARLAEEMEADKAAELQSQFLESLRDTVEVDELELDNLEQFPPLTNTTKLTAKAKQKAQEQGVARAPGNLQQPPPLPKTGKRQVPDKVVVKHKVNQTSKQANQKTCARAHTHTQTHTHTHTHKAHTQAKVQIVVSRNVNDDINGVWEALVGKTLGTGFLLEGRLSDGEFLKVQLTSTCISTPHTTHNYTHACTHIHEHARARTHTQTQTHHHKILSKPAW